MKGFKKFALPFMAASLAFASVGCSDSEGGVSGETAELTSQEVALTAADVPTISEADMKRFGDNLNAFSHDLEQAVGKSKSYVFSAFSYHSALSMTSFGAKGTTYDEMAATLHLEGNKNEAATLNGGMRLKLRYDGQAEKSKFEIANRIWVDKSSEIVPTFTEAMDNYYKAPLKVVDFKNDYKKYVGVINTWVSNNTGEMIKDLLHEGDITADTRMVLVNAIHFDGEWAFEFEANNTSDAEFKTGDAVKNVKMMHLGAHMISYYRSEDNKYQAAAMDYKGGQFAMMIVLPDDVDGIKAVSSTLNAAEIRKIQEGLAMHHGTISMPKFKIETEIDGETNVAAFKSLGMVKAFEDANFSDMISNQSVAISKIIHKAVIEVDEKGTKAAAATAVMVSETASMPPEDFIDFIADHPFEFILYHKASGTVLFSGQYWGE